MRRWIRAVDLVGIVVGANLCAGGVNAVVRASLAANEAEEVRPKAPPALAMAPVPPIERYDSIVKRNVFNHGEPVPGEEIEAPAEAAVPAEACDLPIEVLSVVYVPSDPSLSLATFLDKSGPKPRIRARRVGEELDGFGTVRRAWSELTPGELVPDALAEITTPEGRVVLCRSDEPSQATPQMPAASGARVASGAGIKKVSDTQFEVAQAEVDAVMAGGMMTEARNVLVVPYFENGSAAGFKLSRVKPASILAKIGLTSGDIIRRINGYDINTPEKALQVYGLLKNEKQISVDLTRGGQPKTLTYVIR